MGVRSGAACCMYAKSYVKIKKSTVQNDIKINKTVYYLTNNHLRNALRRFYTRRNFRFTLADF